MEHGDGDGSGSDRRYGGRGRGGGGSRQFFGMDANSMRRPHQDNSEASVNEMNNQFNNVSIDEVVKRSELSADAAEFIPQSMMNVQSHQNNHNQGWRPRPNLQDRLTAARGPSGPPMPQYANHSHSQYVYSYSAYFDNDSSSNYSHDSGYNNYHRNHENNVENNRHESSSLHSVISYLNSAMHTLTRNPDQFENLVEPLVSSITPHLNNQANTQEIISAIIIKCINDSNFRYSGARLCSHLDVENVPSNDSAEDLSIFRETLYARCREETEKLSNNWPKITNHSPDDEKICHGLMLSLAELVVQLDSSILGKRLIEVISIALKNPGPNTAKYICQSLKLAGQYLERDSTRNRNEVERVMRELSDLVIKNRVDVHIGRLVNSVVELRSGNWGRVTNSHTRPVEVNHSTNQHQFNHQPQQQYSDEPVLYGPDGCELSLEERRFCQNIADGDEPNDDIWPGFNDPDEEEENDRIAEAYEEFLKLSEKEKINSEKINRG